MIVHCLYDSGPGSESESESVPSESEFMCVLSYYLQTWGQLHQNVIYYYYYYYFKSSVCDVCVCVCVFQKNTTGVFQWNTSPIGVNVIVRFWL